MKPCAFCLVVSNEYIDIRQSTVHATTAPANTAVIAAEAGIHTAHKVRSASPGSTGLRENRSHLFDYIFAALTYAAAQLDRPHLAPG